MRTTIRLDDALLTDAKEVAAGYECGISIENYNDLKTGDIIEAYQIDLITPELTS